MSIYSLRFIDILSDQILVGRIFWSSICTHPNSYFSGFRNKDVAFLHAPSKTLIVADLIFNLPATEQVVSSVFL